MKEEEFFLLEKGLIYLTTRRETTTSLKKPILPWLTKKMNVLESIDIVCSYKWTANMD